MQPDMGTISSGSRKVKPDPDHKMLAAHRSGCLNGKNADDCHAYAEYLRANGDVRKALAFFKVNCDEYKHAASCLESGSIMSERRRQGIASVDMPVALKYFERGCELGLSSSCYSSGMLLMAPILSDYALPRDYPKGITYLKKSCKMNHGNACLYLAEMYMIGISSSAAEQQPDEKIAAGTTASKDFLLEPNMAKVFAYTQKACDLNCWRACFNLSQLYAVGGGVDKNADKSKFYKDRYKELLEQEKLKDKR